MARRASGFLRGRDENMKAIDQLTDDQVLALARWIKKHTPRTWRSRLDEAWQRGGAGVTGYSAELQQIRNNHGPSLVAKLRTQDILEAGEQVASAYGQSMECAR